MGIGLWLIYGMIFIKKCACLSNELVKTVHEAHIIIQRVFDVDFLD